MHLTLCIGINQNIYIYIKKELPIPFVVGPSSIMNSELSDQFEKKKEKEKKRQWDFFFFA